MLNKDARIAKLEKELQELRMKVLSLESYSYIWADGCSSAYADRNWNNSVSLREVVMALAKKMGVDIKVSTGGAALHLIPAAGKSEP